MAYTCDVNNCSNGSYWLKNWEKLFSEYVCLHKHTTDIAVTLLSGKYSYLDIL